MIRLGVNIDHIATLRQARQTNEPDPVWAAVQAELGGADGITVHLREDRRHIQDRDVEILRKTVRSKLNLEMAVAGEIVEIACRIMPDQATLVPEKRQEITTEGGLDVAGQFETVCETVRKLKYNGMQVALFLDPDERQIEAGVRTGCDAVELHTGRYAADEQELQPMIRAAELVSLSSVRLHAGHGLTYLNTLPIARIPGMCELNIGHSIISRSCFIGLQTAVREMKTLLLRASEERMAR